MVGYSHHDQRITAHSPRRIRESIPPDLETYTKPQCMPFKRKTDSFHFKFSWSSKSLIWRSVDNTSGVSGMFIENALRFDDSFSAMCGFSLPRNQIDQICS